VVPKDSGDGPRAADAEVSADPWLLGASQRSALVLVFGVQLRALRIEAGLSEEDLATKCRVARSTIYRTEIGRRKPRLSLILALCGSLGVSPDALMCDLLPRGKRGNR
jgi:DNA-binding XRE family transcriptional regulator